MQYDPLDQVYISRQHGHCDVIGVMPDETLCIFNISYQIDDVSVFVP